MDSVSSASTANHCTGCPPKLILDPLPRHAAPNRSFTLSGHLSDEVTQTSVIALKSDGNSIQFDTETSGNKLSSQLSLSRGKWTIEVIGDLQSGPLPLAQFTLCIGCADGEDLRATNPQKHRYSESPEQYMLALINRSRLEEGLAPYK